jgi:hypothetical protein
VLAGSCSLATAEDFSCRSSAGLHAGFIAGPLKLILHPSPMTSLRSSLRGSAVPRVLPGAKAGPFFSFMLGFVLLSAVPLVRRRPVRPGSSPPCANLLPGQDSFILPSELGTGCFFFPKLFVFCSIPSLRVRSRAQVADRLRLWWRSSGLIILFLPPVMPSASTCPLPIGSSDSMTGKRSILRGF